MAHQAAKRVIVGMSGGVDSSVAAYLLLQQGYEVEGLFMKNWNEDDGTEYCTAMTDLADAAHVAQSLGIKLHTANFAAEYWDRVFQHFLSEYRLGRTPNPDILCNKEIKFKAFLDRALELGADAIATGHYARIDASGGEARLMKGLDTGKDQSYFLHAVSALQLRHTLFPLGELQKREVREIAERQGLITHDKKDSTGICFIGERRFKDFLMQYLPAQEGDICTVEGEKIGRHSGLMFHTIGQRQGLGIGGKKGQQELAWYVAAKDLQHNVLKVVQGNDHPALFAPALAVEQLEWVSGKPPVANTPLHTKIRYRQAEQACSLRAGSDGGDYTVHFSEPQRAISPGQSCVFYSGDYCLGGGIIQAALPTSGMEVQSA
ncbi:MAG: tRNA 2-thiouridine(34) synthase MnmA [Pseudomonadota bacterium]